MRSIGAFMFLLFIATLPACKTLLKAAPGIPGCKATGSNIFKIFPEKVWIIDDISGTSNCELYNPLIYFGKDNKCVISTKAKTVTGTYQINECDNLLQVYMPKDTMLYVISTLVPPKMILTQVARLANGELATAQWRFTQYKQGNTQTGK